MVTSWESRATKTHLYPYGRVAQKVEPKRFMTACLYLSRLYLDSCKVFKWIVIGRKLVNCIPPIGCEATRLSRLTVWVVIHSETPRSYARFRFYFLEILSVLDLDLYKLHVNILDKQNGCVEYKETDRTWQLVYNLAKISNRGYY
jgi:hypothetical protein